MTKRKNKKSRSQGRGLTAVAIVLAVLLLGAFGFCIYVRSCESIYPGVSVEGLSLAGMTREQAARALKAAGITQDAQACSLTVRLPEDNVLEIDALRARAFPTAENAAYAAFMCGREGGFIQNAAEYLRCAVFGRELTLSDTGAQLDEDYIREEVRAAAEQADRALMESSLTENLTTLTLVKGVGQVLVDEDALFKDIVSALKRGDFAGFDYVPELRADESIDLDALHAGVYRAAADAFYEKETGITPETVGRDFDLDAAAACWNAAAPGEEVVIPLRFTEPEVTAAWLETHLFADELGKRTSGLGTSSAARVNNVALAASSIDGIVLMPGEEFSYNDALGKRTEAAGYQPAGAYLNGEVVTEIGGGICQVSSTLYCAAMLANLKITARTCHYFGVDYLPAGMDATVSWGGPEFKFVNSRDYPVKLRAAVDRAKWNVTVSILGTDTDGSSVSIETKWKDYDDGYGATTFRCVYDSEGELISRTQEAVSRYHFHEEEEEEEEEETPEPEDTEPEDTEPEDTEPEDPEPEDTKPEDTEPEGTEPENTEPEGTGSGGTPPEEPEPEPQEP